MRNLIPILLAVVVISSGCDPDGYSCNSEGCYDDDDNPQYQTLDDCINLCDGPKPGGCGSHGIDWVDVDIAEGPIPVLARYLIKRKKLF